MKTPSALHHFAAGLGFGHKLLNLIAVCAALALPAVALAGNLTGRYATITLDGSLSDWLASDVMYGPTEIAAGVPASSTFTNIYVANDATNVYVALQLAGPASITNNWTTSIFIDGDMTSTTGFNGGWMSSGYDHLVQYGAAGTTYSVYGFAGTSQGAWSWNWIGLINYSYTDYVVEWAIPISSLGLTGNKMRMEFYVTGGDVTTETWAYQWESGVGTYTLASPPAGGVPTITAVEGGPNKVVVTYSKDVNPATAGAVTNYTLSGGVTVNSATTTIASPREITLATGQQTLGTTYTLTVNHVTDTSGTPIAANSQKSFVSSILIDGSFDDWAGVPLLYNNDPGSSTATDFKEVYGYSDTNYVYFRVTLWEPSAFVSSQNNIFIDTDNTSSSGNAFWGGAELLIQGGVGYQEKNGGFNEGLINGLDFLCAGSGNTNYEFRIARSATYASDGLPVFRANTINFAFDGELNWVTVNRMPPTATTTIPLALVEVPVPLGPLTITFVNGQVTLNWKGPGTLQSCDSLSSGTWTDVPNGYDGYTVTPSESKLFYRLSQ